MLNFMRPLQANGSRKNNYKVDNIVINQPLSNISRKQNINKLTKLSINQQYKIPQPLKKMSLKQPQTNRLDTLQTEENQTSSVIHSPTFSKQSISEVKFGQHTFATSQQSINTTPSESMIARCKQAWNELDCKLDHKMFNIWDDLEKSHI